MFQMTWASSVFVAMGCRAFAIPGLRAHRRVFSQRPLRFDGVTGLVVLWWMLVACAVFLAWIA